MRAGGRCGAVSPTRGCSRWRSPRRTKGLGPLPVELAVAFVELGRHAVPGPLVETVMAAALLTEPGPAKRLLPALASGERSRRWPRAVRLTGRVRTGR
jgi:hypothetical protein